MASDKVSLENGVKGDEHCLTHDYTAGSYDLDNNLQLNQLDGLSDHLSDGKLTTDSGCDIIPGPKKDPRNTTLVPS